MRLRPPPGFDPSGGYVLGGVRIDDPWMAIESRSADVDAWVRYASTQSTMTGSSWPHSAAISDLLEEAMDWERRSATAITATGQLRLEAESLRSPARVLICRQGADPQIGYDPLANCGPDGNPLHVFGCVLSPDGKTAALLVGSNGDEVGQLRLLDTESGNIADYVALPRVHSSANRVQWLPDSSGLLFVALEGAARDFNNQVFWLDLGSGVFERQQVVWSRSADFRAVHVQADGRAIASEGYSAPNPVAIGRFAAGKWNWQPFIHKPGDATFGQLRGDEYVCVSYSARDLGRVVGIPLDTDDPNDETTWREIVPETTAVLASVTVWTDYLYVHAIDGGRSRIIVYGIDGHRHDELSLPAESRIDSGPTAMYAADVVPATGLRFIVSDPANRPSSILVTEPGGPATWRRNGRPAESNIRVQRSVIPTEDGVGVLVSRIGDPQLLQEPHPTIVWAYGGFNTFGTGAYDPALFTLAALGGEVVIAHISGDGDRGRRVWERGRLELKQHCYDDIVTVARHLIAEGTTTPQLLGVAGISNGGLMSAVVALQNPELWQAVVCLAGWVDPLGSARFPFLDLCARMELGDLDDPIVVDRVRRLSPLHLIQPHVPYPSFYFDSGRNDTRVPSYMPQKLVAELCRTSSASVEFREWDRGGHGQYDDPETQLERKLSWIIFMARELGLPNH